MSNKKVTKPSDEWLTWVKTHVRYDSETGKLWWKRSRKGVNIAKPIGCLDRNGYVKMQLCNKSVYGHQVVWFLCNGVWPVGMLDHINQNPSDNRVENLRETTHTENALNSKTWATNRSGIKGASIMRDGRYKVTKAGKFLGYYHTAREARDAYSRHS